MPTYTMNELAKTLQIQERKPQDLDLPPSNLPSLLPKTHSSTLLSVITGETTLAELPIGEQVRISSEAAGMLSANFGADYMASGTANFGKFRLVWEMALQKGYTQSEFRAAVQSLVERCKYPTWTAVEFFEKERPGLHSAAWKNNLIHTGKNAESDFDAYGVENAVLWCYSPAKPYQLKLIVRRGVSQIRHSNGGEMIDAITKERTVLALTEKSKTKEEVTLQDKYIAQGKKVLELIAEKEEMSKQIATLTSERETLIRRVLELENMQGVAV